MTGTPDLVEALVSGAAPVRRARRPLVRAALWLLLAAALVGALAAWHGVRPDFSARLRDPGFCVSFAAALLTGALAALAAMEVSLPDRSRLWLVLPLPAAALWVGGISWGCLAHWVAFDPGHVQTAELLRCVTTLLASSIPLSAAMFWLLRHAARLRPVPSLFAGALAVAALTSAALALLHEFDASLMILAWNFGTALLVLAVDAAVGRRVLRS